MLAAAFADYTSRILKQPNSMMPSRREVLRRLDELDGHATLRIIVGLFAAGLSGLVIGIFISNHLFSIPPPTRNGFIHFLILALPIILFCACPLLSVMLHRRWRDQVSKHVAGCLLEHQLLLITIQDVENERLPALNPGYVSYIGLVGRRAPSRRLSDRIGLLAIRFSTCCRAVGLKDYPRPLQGLFDFGKWILIASLLVALAALACLYSPLTRLSPPLVPWLSWTRSLALLVFAFLAGCGFLLRSLLNQITLRAIRTALITSLQEQA